MTIKGRTAGKWLRQNLKAGFLFARPSQPSFLTVFTRQRHQHILEKGGLVEPLKCINVLGIIALHCVDRSNRKISEGG